MQAMLKDILTTTGGWIPVSKLIRLTGQDFLFPFYHTVSNSPLPHVDRVYPVRSMARFCRDLEFLTRHFQPVGLDEVKAFRDGGRTPSGPCMFLSFDDGLSGLYNMVAPELLKRKIPAAFFINTGFMDNRNLFFRYKASLILHRLEDLNYPEATMKLFQRRFRLERGGIKHLREFILGIGYRRRAELDDMARMIDLDFKTFLKIRKPYLTHTQIEELARSGFYIGAHGSDHPLFTELDEAHQLAEFRDSLSMIQQEFGLSYGLFSFPFTDHGVSSSFFDALSGEGMPPLDATFGTAGLKMDPVPFHFQRVPMEVRRVAASRLMKGEYLYYLLKGLMGRNKITRE
jgi:peptidoglycan/xylan/chitin deacetylase (PgdA/CDA1 family)